MAEPFKMAWASLARSWNLLKGRRYLRIVRVNDDKEEVYRFILRNGGQIRLYCTETIYEMVFDSVWVKNDKHRAYFVHGVCDEEVPLELADRLKKGFYVGQLLPNALPSVEQKKAAIQAFIALIAEQLKSQK